ncbi:hypothetical protein [Bordetella genomosp. 12]|uniref:hypothetical protein n=1 Tax=Bordetella genomosp. 12 TaxID=463035 RepID=UPI001ABFA4AC|nr:hypothetical protein [Bordetella genomosp. 12]
MSRLGLWGDYSKKIVCNELRQQNLLSISDWAQEASDCATKFSLTTYQGYKLWAVPCLRLVRQYPWFARCIATVVRWMVADIRFERGLRARPHYVGRLIRQRVFWPTNWFLGKCLLILRHARATGAERAAVCAGPRKLEPVPFL